MRVHAQHCHVSCNGILYIQTANTSKTWGEQEWVETLTHAIEEKGVPPILEDVYDSATELMDLGALPEVERGPNPDNQKSLAAHRCRKARDRLDKTRSNNSGVAMADADFKRACHNIALKHGTKESRQPT